MRGRKRAVLGCLAIAATTASGASFWLLDGGITYAVDAGRSALGREPGPIRLAPVFDHLRSSPSFAAPPPPGSDAAGRVMATLERVEASARRSRYQHRTRVDARAGRYDWDCSGMAAWVLERSAPRARRSLNARRPVARTFHRTIAAAPTDRARRGWRRVDHIRDVRPGDLFAWERPPGFRSRNTGHVGFVVNRPLRVREGLWAVRILDSTSLAHQDDTRAHDADGGLGRGTMAFVTDGAGHATAYGWRGTRSRGHIETPVVFGRVE